MRDEGGGGGVTLAYTVDSRSPLRTSPSASARVFPCSKVMFLARLSYIEREVNTCAHTQHIQQYNRNTTCINYQTENIVHIQHS